MQNLSRKRIVIVGAGFAGLYAALELDKTVARNPDIEVLLINPQNFLLFTPMLHEVASGSLDPSSIVVPIRQVLKHVQLFQAETTAIDVNNRTLTASYGVENNSRIIHFDYLLIAAGSQTRFPPGLQQHAHGMKSIHDALLLRNWLIELLERAELEEDTELRQALLTIVVAGGGFSGVETIGAINDFLQDVAPFYPKALSVAPKLLLVESNHQLLPQFETELGQYTAKNLRSSGIDIRLGTKVQAYDGRLIELDMETDNASVFIRAHTLIWTAGVCPSSLLHSVHLPKSHGKIIVDATLAVPDYAGIWACGDCALMTDPDGKPYPPTAQHAVRQGKLVGRNIAATVLGQVSNIKPFRYKMLGQSAAIGHKRAVATLAGVRFSGFIAWLFWRGAYLMMLPKFERKLRVLLQWLLEACFSRDSVQLLTVHSIRSGRVEQLLESAQAANKACEEQPGIQ